MDPGEVKKLGPLGLRLIEGLRGPALHIVRAIKEEILSSDKGPEAILQALVTALRPRRQQEARELYLAGSREGGLLSRQYGEAMSTYILRRKTWYAMLTDLDGEIKLPELLLAEQILMNAGVTEQHQMMVRTSLSQVISIEGVCNELINQHGSLHLREKRGPSTWRPRFGGKGGWKGKSGKGPQTYFAEDGAPDYWEQGGEAFASIGDGSWESYEEAGSEHFGSESPTTVDHEYLEAEDPVLQVFTAMLENGLDENYDQESAEYAAEVVQMEAEAYFTRQRAQQKGTAASRGGTLRSGGSSAWRSERPG